MEVAWNILTSQGSLGLSAGWTSATQAVLLVLGLVGLLVVFLSGRVARQKGRKSVRATPRASGETGRDLEELLVELDDLARGIHARLDERLARLETLLRDADRRIELLSRLENDARESPAVDITLQDSEACDELVNAGESSRFADVYRLADQDLSPLEIAKRTGRPTGEVELILSLRRTQRGHLSESSVGQVSGLSG